MRPWWFGAVHLSPAKIASVGPIPGQRRVMDFVSYSQSTLVKTCQGPIASCLAFAEKIRSRNVQHQTASPFISPLPSDFARFGYATKGEPPSSPRICPPKQRPLYCLQIFLDPSFSATGVRKSHSELCVQHCFKCSANRWLEISWGSHTQLDVS